MTSLLEPRLPRPFRLACGYPNLNRVHVAVILFVLPALLATMVPAVAHADPPTPRQQYASIMKTYSPVSSGLRDAKTDLEREAAVNRMAAFSSQFIDLASQHPDDPIALTALKQAVQIVGSTDSAAQIVWEINRANFPAGGNDGSARKIVNLVLRDHLQSDQLGPVIDRMRYGYRLEFEKCLAAVLEKNPHQKIKGLACLALAQNLSDRLRMLGLVNDRPELATCYTIVFGKDYLPALQQLGRTDLDARIEQLFRRAASEFVDVKFRNTTVGKVAKSELYEREHLSIGKIAPDIQGKDQDGNRFKLSDYRGKVVLLYFWSEY